MVAGQDYIVLYSESETGLWSTSSIYNSYRYMGEFIGGMQEVEVLQSLSHLVFYLA